MKRKLFSFIFTICMLVPCLAICVGCNLDLSHKHYLTEYGVCRTCREDLSIEIPRNNNLEYVSGEVVCSVDDYTYFTFVSHGEDFVTITIDPITAQIDDTNCIRLYTASNTTNLYLSHYVGQNYSYYHPNKLVDGETYYIRINVKVGGKLRITVSPFIES